MGKLDKVQLNFDVLSTLDPRFLYVMDSSIWSVIAGKPAIIEVLIPGERTPIVLPYEKNQINVFQSVNLMYNCPSGDCLDSEFVFLPDGVYEITIKGSPDKYNFTRRYLRTEQLKLEINRALITLNSDCNNVSKKVKDLFIDITFLMATAEAHIVEDNVCKAQDLIFRVNGLLNEIKKCKGCVGA